MKRETAAQKKARLIRLIHIAKSQVGMNDTEYRTLIANVSGGKTSSKLLSVEQLETVLRHMKAQGFEVAIATTGGKQLVSDNPTAQMGKIRALWLEMHTMGIIRSPSENALQAYCRKYSGANWQQDIYAMREIIERLKQWKARFERD